MNKALYKMMFTQGLSLIGSRMTGIALGIWLFKTTGKTASLLLIPFFNELPTLFLAYFGGVLVDRMPRKTVLVLSDMGQAIGSLFLLLSIHYGFFHISILFAVVFIQGLFVMVQEPAADSTIGWLTRDEERDRVNGIKEMLFPAAGILGPAITGILYPFIGLKGILMVDLMSFLLAATVLSTLTLPKMAHENHIETSFVEDSRVGYHFLKSNKGLFGLILYFSLTNFLLNGPLELIIPIGLSRFDREGIVSMLLMTMSMASFIGALTVGHFSVKKKRVTLIFGLMTLNAIMFIGFGLSQSKVLVFVTLFFAMMPLPMVSAYFKSILQKKVPTDLQGRVFSLSYQIAFGSAPLSFLIVGPLVDNVLTPFISRNKLSMVVSFIGDDASAGMRLIFVISGILIIFLTVIAWINNDIRYVERSPNN